MPPTYSSFDVFNDCCSCTPGSLAEARLRNLASQRPLVREAALVLAYSSWFYIHVRGDDPESFTDGQKAASDLEQKFGVDIEFWAIQELHRWLRTRKLSQTLLERTED